MQNGFIIDYRTIAARLARANDDDQAGFFRTFCHELRACCETDHNAQMQLAGVNAKLSSEDKELIRMIGLPDEIP